MCLTWMWGVNSPLPSRRQHEMGILCHGWPACRNREYNASSWGWRRDGWCNPGARLADPVSSTRQMDRVHDRDVPGIEPTNLRAGCGLCSTAKQPWGAPEVALMWTVWKPGKDVQVASGMESGKLRCARTIDSGSCTQTAATHASRLAHALGRQSPALSVLPGGAGFRS
jgi:hypothetical protein